MMDSSLVEKVKSITHAHSVQKLEVIQNLWSGYGEIIRISLDHDPDKTLIVKHVKLPEGSKHPRGWNTNNSHARKVKSYQVEIHWYQHWMSQALKSVRMAHCLGAEELEDGFFILLEDLDAAGYPLRLHDLQKEDIEACVSWLANFHASYLYSYTVNIERSNQSENKAYLPYQGLWESGTYWHLETRPDELEVLDDVKLKKYSSQIDILLKASPYQTLVHGDAKLANFCFSADHQVSAVDFQYVGHGCGMKDLAYFIGSVFSDSECEVWVDPVLDMYFKDFEKAIDLRLCLQGSSAFNSGESLFDDFNFKEFEKNWRELFPIAWADFHRFLKGWSPGHWKINSYSEQIVQKVILDIETAHSNLGQN